LRERDLDLGFAHSDAADLHLAMGSSLRVNPAAEMP
jgi:NAD-dependent SIR2 family protein deacetylase